MLVSSALPKTLGILQRCGSSVFCRLSSKGLPQTSEIGEATDDVSAIESEIKEAQRIKQSLRQRRTGVESFSITENENEGTSSVSSLSAMSVEKERHSNEKQRRKQHFESSASKSLLELAGYNDTSRAVQFESEHEYSEYVQREEQAQRKFGADYKKSRQSFDNSYESVRSRAFSTDKEEFIPLHKRLQDPKYKTSSSEDYNYGLSGLGKGKRSPPGRSRHTIPRLHGEVLFGLFPCLMALQENRREAYQVFVKEKTLVSPRPQAAELLRLAKEKGAEVIACRGEVLDALAHDRPHQGFCLDASTIKPIMMDRDENSMEALPETNGKRLMLVMDGIQDPMNFGAVLRSSYYLGVDRVITVKDNSCRLSPVVSKASAGVLEIMPIYAVKYLANFIQGCQKQGWRILGTTVEEKEGQRSRSAEVTPLNEVKVNQDTVVIIGNEGQGVETSIETLCDDLVSIQPTKDISPLMDSLNVSVATGIILHHLLYNR